MSSRLEQFIRDNRESFDSEPPPKRVWEQLQQQTGIGKNKTRPIVWLTPGRWAVAIAISVLVAGATWYLTREDSGNRQTITSLTRPSQATPAPQTGSSGTASTGSPAQTRTDPQTELSTQKASTGEPAQTTSTGSPAAGDQTAEPDPDAFYREKMGYYAHLVRIRHKELGTIKKDEPLLYRQFTGDVKKLDSVYQDLEKQLPDNPNHEQLLQGMLQALQLQMKLLNHQLDIIKKINHSKKTAHEKAYKTT